MIDGKKIKAQRKRLHISQYDLADGITTQGTISSLERNSRTPNGDVLAKVLERLSLSLDEVVVGNQKNDNQIFLQQADTFSMNFKYKEVLSQLSLIKEIDDPEQKAHFTFLKTNAEMWLKKNYDDAIFGYNQLIQNLAGKNNIYAALATTELGVVYESKGDPEKATAYFEKLPALLDQLDLNKNIFWSLMLLDNLSKYYSNRKKYQECTDTLDKAIALAKNNSSSFFMDSFYYVYAETLHDLHGEWTIETKKYMLKSWTFADFLNDNLIIEKTEKWLNIFDIFNDN